MSMECSVEGCNKIYKKPLSATDEEVLEMFVEQLSVSHTIIYQGDPEDCFSKPWTNLSFDLQAGAYEVVSYDGETEEDCWQFENQEEALRFYYNKTLEVFGEVIIQQHQEF